MEDKIKVFIEKCRAEAITPFYAKPGDAGMDVCSAEEVIIKPGETVIVKTGLKFAIPEGFEIQVRPRSGISYNTPLRLANSPGTIDSGYRDELGIIITNNSEYAAKSAELLKINNPDNKKGSYIINIGDRIAQIILARVPKMIFAEVENVEKIGTNRGGGFGSTGY